MTGRMTFACLVASALLLAPLAATPAKAQFGGGDADMMTQFAPMLEMMKAKMGKKRFAQLMQTVGPMMSGMMENGGGGFGGMMGGAGPGMNLGGMNLGGMMGGAGLGGMGGGDMSALMGNGQMMAMIPQLISLANTGGGGRHGRRRHR